MLVKGFVAGFVSALVLCCLGFGAYWMFKGDEPNEKTQQQLSNLQNEVDRLKNDCTNFTNEIERLKDELREAEDKLKKEEQALLDAKEKEDQAKAKAEAKAKEAEAKAKAKAEILELVQKKKLNECRSHPGWKKFLTQNERLAVESILNLDQEQYKGTYKKNVEKYVSTLKISAWNDIIQARQEIIKLKNSK